MSHCRADLWSQIFFVWHDIIGLVTSSRSATYFSRSKIDCNKQWKSGPSRGVRGEKKKEKNPSRLPTYQVINHELLSRTYKKNLFRASDELIITFHWNSITSNRNRQEWTIEFHGNVVLSSEEKSLDSSSLITARNRCHGVGRLQRSSRGIMPGRPNSQWIVPWIASSFSPLASC